jgi:hypothetical protein
LTVYLATALLVTRPCPAPTITLLLLVAVGLDRFTLAAEFATRNVSIATALGLALAAQPEYVLFAGLYLTCEIPMLTAGSTVYRR